MKRSILSVYGLLILNFNLGGEEMKVICNIFHRKHWFSNDFGTWWTSWEEHGGKYTITCTKCGREYQKQHEEEI